MQEVKMSLVEYLIDLKNNNLNAPLPQYIEASDCDGYRIYVDGKWITSVNKCGIVENKGKLVYFETDDERGYVSLKKEYENYNAMMEEVSRWYQNIVNASKFDNSFYLVGMNRKRKLSYAIRKKLKKYCI